MMLSMTVRATARVLIVCAAAGLYACGTPHAGPKLIVADGTTYAACGGATWFLNDSDRTDPEARSYTVYFADADGKTHELKRVRALTVSDLPSDSKACAGVIK